MAKFSTCTIAIPPRHCGLDPQSPLYIVISGNLVKRVWEHKLAMTKEVLLTNATMLEWGGGLRVEPAMTGEVGDCGYACNDESVMDLW